jgi:hypothetical protein
MFDISAPIDPADWASAGSLTGPCFLQSFIVNLITEQAVKQLAVVAVRCLRKFTQQINLSSKPRVKGALKPGCRII